MKKNKLFMLSALALAVVVSVSGCGLYNVNNSRSKGFINSKNIANVKTGVSENYILARFGKPSSKKGTVINNRSASVWAYCGKKVRNAGYFYVFNSKKVVSRCAFFTFNRNGKLIKTGFKNY